jgi:hypothetical protein
MNASKLATRAILAIGAALATVAVPGSANAAISAPLAICSLRFDPSNNTLGHSGHIVLSLKPTLESCSDANVSLQVSYFCSTNATHGNCTTNNQYHYSQQELLTLWQVLQQAQATGLRVEVFHDNGNFTRGYMVRTVN